MSTNEQNNSQTKKRHKSSSNESSSNQQKKKTLNESSYRLRVSFQKCSSHHQTNNNNHESDFYSSKCEIQKSQINTELQEKIKALFFSKSKSESIHTSLVSAAVEESSGLFISSKMNSERHNPIFYDWKNRKKLSI